MMPRRLAPGNPTYPRPPPPPFPSFDILAQQQQQQKQQEEAALSISDQRTLYLVNIFIVNTTRFLNRFSATCEEKLALVHRRILRLDASLTLLEAQLRSIDPPGEIEENCNGSQVVGHNPSCNLASQS